MDDILLNVESKERRYAHLRNGSLHDLVVERRKSRQLSGNIYRGRVTNILHNIQSAFIDINEGDNGFIHISDIVENTKKFEDIFEMEFDSEDDSNGFEGFEAVTGAAQGGWGLYNHEVGDDNHSEYDNTVLKSDQGRVGATNSRGGRNSPGNSSDYQSDNSSVYSSYSAFDNESSSVVLSEYDDSHSDEDEIE